MHRRLLTLALLTAAVAAASSQATAAPAPSKCRAAVGQASDSTLLGFRVRCNFAVRRLSVRTDLGIRRVDRARLDDEAAGDRMDCRRRSRSLASCGGRMKANARLRERLRVVKRGCKPAKLRFRATGGDDAPRSFVLTVTRRGSC